MRMTRRSIIMTFDVDENHVPTDIKFMVDPKIPRRVTALYTATLAAMLFKEYMGDREDAHELWNEAYDVSEAGK